MQMTPVEFHEAVSDDRLSCTDALLQSSLRVLCGTDWKAYPRHGPRPACSPVAEAAAGAEARLQQFSLCYVEHRAVIQAHRRRRQRNAKQAHGCASHGCRPPKVS